MEPRPKKNHPSPFPPCDLRASPQDRGGKPSPTRGEGTKAVRFSPFANPPGRQWSERSCVSPYGVGCVSGVYQRKPARRAGRLGFAASAAVRLVVSFALVASLAATGGQ